MRLFFALLLIAAVFTPATVIHSQDKPKEFALYVLPHKRGAKVLNADVKKPAGKPLLTTKDIEFYQKDRHEIGLTYTAGKRFREMASKELDGKSFAVFVGDDLIYTGAFWPSIFSGSYDGVNIDTTFTFNDFPVLPIHFGYPGEEYAKGIDPRSDPRILKAFEDAKMLRQELVIKGKCTAMRNTMKRRASVVFTFTVDSVLKGDYKENQITFETFADGEGAKLLGKLESTGTPYGDTRTFDKEKQVTLKFEQRTDLNQQPYWFWFRSVG